MAGGVQSFISNHIDFQYPKYAAIIGLCPSRGARSPILWNRVYEEKKIDVRMYPFDVVSIASLVELLAYLDGDSNFMGGAVAAPYKEHVAKWLGINRTERVAKEIGAVNCLFRDKNGLLRGVNTDASASLQAYESQFGPIFGKQTLVMGFGGVGKAVAAEMKMAGAYVSVVTTKKRAEVDSIYNHVDWVDVNRMLSTTNVLINATDLGFSGSGKENLSPLTYEQLLLLQKDCIVYDLIYQPEKTLLMKLSNDCHIKTINGLYMNKIQAASSFNYANYSSNLKYDDIYQIMNC